MWIPCDSSMTLGSVIDDERVAALRDISQLQQKVEAANDMYNAQVKNKLAMDMSQQQLKQMKTTKQSEATMEKLKEAHALQDALTTDSLLDLVNARMEFENSYLELMRTREQTKITKTIESPLKYDKEPQLLPFGSDSMNMDVQYFRCDTGTQGARAHVSQVASHCARSFQGQTKGGSYGGGRKVEKETERHMASQTENNNLVGTLVITARATHKMAKMYEPLYDADKLLRAWNEKVEGEFINLPGNVNGHYAEWTRAAQATAGVNEYDVQNENKIAIVTGQTYGSNFIGFIHFLKASSTRSYQSVRKSAVNAQTEINQKLIWGAMSGSWGLDATAAAEVKSLMSDNRISSHVSVQTYGLIPSIASQGVVTVLKKFSKFDAADTDAKLSLLASKKVSNGAGDGFTRAKKKAVRAGQIAGIERAKLEAVLTGIGEGDRKKNQVLNMNSLMESFDDYIKHVRDAEGGCPLTNFISEIRKVDVIECWMEEYRPDLWEKANRGTANAENYDRANKKDSDDSDSDSGEDDGPPMDDE